MWFLAEKPAGAPVGFHGCEMEVTVDARSEHVLGYSLSNVGWGKCREVERKIRVAERPRLDRPPSLYNGGRADPRLFRSPTCR